MDNIKRPRIDNVLDMFAPLADFTLIAGLDQEKVPIVRKLLTQKSVYFEKLLGPSFREGSQQEVTLQDIDGPTLTTIIKFIYSDSIDLTEECVANILDGASRLELVTLEKMCEDFLHRNMSKDNCFQTFVLADKHCFEMLRASALECVATNLENIPKTDLLQLDGRVLGEILECGKVYMAETNIFNLLVEWVEQNEIVHSPFMPTLLKSIRLEHLPGEFILNVASPIFNRYASSTLISVEYRRRIVNHHISPRRCLEKGTGKSIFYAQINKNYSFRGNYQTTNGIPIYIYRCYPDCKRITSVPVSTSPVDQGWAFHGGRFYQMGGYYSSEGGRTSAEVECIDMDTKERIKLPNMLNARSAFKPLVSGQYIYVFGGKNKQGSILDCERFDTQNNEWHALPRMPRELGNCSAIEMNNKFLVVGEVEESYKVYLRWCDYDSETKKWYNRQSYTIMSNKNANVAVFKNGNQMFNVIVWRTIYSVDSTDISKRDMKGKPISLPGIEDWNIVECAGSPYIFYKSSGKRKFGRIVFNQDECSIVDSVESDCYFTEGFLFMQ